MEVVTNQEVHTSYGRSRRFRWDTKPPYGVFVICRSEVESELRSRRRRLSRTALATLGGELSESRLRGKAREYSFRYHAIRRDVVESIRRLTYGRIRPAVVSWPGTRPHLAWFDWLHQRPVSIELVDC